MKNCPVYKVTKQNIRTGNVTSFEGTLQHLITETFSYTLLTGASYTGFKKINTNPKTIKQLITNLNNAVNNSNSHGYAGVVYELVGEVVSIAEEG